MTTTDQLVVSITITPGVFLGEDSPGSLLTIAGNLLSISGLLALAFALILVGWHRRRIRKAASYH